MFLVSVAVGHLRNSFSLSLLSHLFPLHIHLSSRNCSEIFITFCTFVIRFLFSQSPFSLKFRWTIELDGIVEVLLLVFFEMLQSIDWWQPSWNLVFEFSKAVSVLGWSVIITKNIGLSSLAIKPGWSLPCILQKFRKSFTHVEQIVPRSTFPFSILWLSHYNIHWNFRYERILDLNLNWMEPNGTKWQSTKQTKIFEWNAFDCYPDSKRKPTRTTIRKSIWIVIIVNGKKYRNFERASYKPPAQPPAAAAAAIWYFSRNIFYFKFDDYLIKSFGLIYALSDECMK